MELMRDGAITAIVTYRYDRFGRNLRQALDHLEEVEGLGGQVVSKRFLVGGSESPPKLPTHVTIPAAPAHGPERVLTRNLHQPVKCVALRTAALPNRRRRHRPEHARRVC